MTPRHLAISLAALAITAAPAAGCGGSSDSANANGAATPHSRTSGSSPKSATGGGTVTIDNFKFAPASLAVARGTRIVVSNHDSTAHTATADSGQSFDTGEIAPGSSATVTLSKAGSYAYHCTIHPFMHGTLVVK